MAKVLGIGGIFFKSPDPGRLIGWYAQWLGITPMDGGSVFFTPDQMPAGGGTVFAPFPADTDYFAPATKEFMFNLVVDNLDGALAQVRAGGAQTLGEVETYDYGRFGRFVDPDGNKVELWEPAAATP